MRNLVLVAVALFAMQVNAGDCRRIASQCVDSAPYKYFSGSKVTVDKVGGCWDYQDTYECIKPSSVDYCSAISNTPGCSQVSTQNIMAFDGVTPLAEKRVYTCYNSTSTPSGTVYLDKSYTLVLDSINKTACDSYSDNPSCKLSSHVCTEGAGYRTINGMSVYKDCWAWSDTYACISENKHDYCNALKVSGCKLIDSICDATAWDGSCNSYTKKYQCGPSQSPDTSNITFLNYSYTVVKDSIDTAGCSDFQKAANCELASEVCTEPGGTRNINGLDVTKDCWAWKRDYTCQTNNVVNECTDLVNKGCVLVSQECIGAKLQNGSCGVTAKQYKCESKPATVTEVEDCSTKTMCADGNCFDTSSQPDKDFSQTIAMMEVMREAGTYVDVNSLEIFKGKKSQCKHKLFGLVNCCKKSSGGAAYGNFQIISTGAKVVGEAADWFVGGYVYDSLQGQDYLQKGLGSILGMTKADGMFNPSFNIYGIGVSYMPSQGFMLTGFDPNTFALQIALAVVSQLMSCTDAENILSMQSGLNLCHYVGSYCSMEMPITGICLETTQSYCCYNSKLAKIINEQGRQQLGLKWGSSGNPNCQGFTVDQLQSIDFTKIDLSEFIADIMPKVPTNSSITTRNQSVINDKIKSYLAK